MNTVKETTLAMLIAAVVVLGSCYYSFVGGQQVMQQNIITYCKADGVYLTEGLMLQCNVMTSKRGAAT